MIGGVLAIQSNWHESLDGEKVWAYFKKLNANSIHGSLDDRNFGCIRSNTGRTMKVTYSCDGLEAQVLFVTPDFSFNHIHNKSITSIDVSQGGLGVSSSTDNTLHVWEYDRDIVRRRLVGHLFDVYTCRFFPSGVVILTGGADMQLNIWDATKAICVATLKGHTAAVTDTVIVELGKNIVSVSKDGSAKLWNCGNSKCIKTIFNGQFEINCCVMINMTDPMFIIQDPIQDELCFGIKNKLLSVGCESGDVYIITLEDCQVRALHRMLSAVLCLCWMDQFSLLIGTEDGSILLLDVRNIASKPKLLCHDSNSAVLCMKTLREGILVSRRDGLCQYYNNEGINTVQLTGPDCDAVYSMAIDNSHVYTSCRDATVRKYKISDFEL